MSIATFALSYIAAKESIEQLILERANTRLSMIVQGFSNIANDIDIYSYINFSHESIAITKDSFSVFQYVTSRLDEDSQKVTVLKATKGG